MAKILIIDDERLKRESLGRDISDWGHTVISADRADVGYSKASAKQPDLILLDLKMPEIDGIECLKMLKNDPETDAIPVIIVSATAEAHKRLPEAIENGADDLLTVPFDNPAILKARINNGLDKAQQLRQLKQLNTQLTKALADVDDQKDRFDELLLALFPEKFADELKTHDRVKPRGFPNVAVLFADIAGFTAWCAQHEQEPELVVDMLEQFIEMCEQVCQDHKLEKIKAIGDGLMAAAGLIFEDHDAKTNSSNAVLCGFDIIRNSKGLLPEGLGVRVGVHMGYVMGGKIGRKKYCFDIWGDTVNTAARVESNGTPGNVVVSSAVWNEVGNFVKGASLGLVEPKGKKAMELWRIDSIGELVTRGR